MINCDERMFDPLYMIEDKQIPSYNFDKEAIPDWEQLILLPEAFQSPILSTPEPHLGATLIDNKGVEMVFVPAGTFLMGSDKTKDLSSWDDERPQHEVAMERGFWIDKYPVTNNAYQAFFDAVGYNARRYWTPDGWNWTKRFHSYSPKNYSRYTDPQQPRVGVTWYEAVAFAKWRGVRLPSEAEWEYAARGKDGRIYPWGDKFDADKAIFRESRGKLAPVGSRPDGASWVGALDMAGNVWEWCSTIFHKDEFAYPFKFDQRDSLNGDQMRMLRGGGYSTIANNLRSAFRFRSEPDHFSFDIGFRCVRPT